MALDSLQPEHPLRVDYLDRVGVLLSTRSKISQDLSDRQKSLDCLKAAWRFRSTPPLDRIKLASELAACLTEQLNHAETADVLEEAVHLLPIACARSMNDMDKIKHIQKFYSLTTMAASASLNAGRSPSHALEILEAGRGVVAGHLLDTRANTSRLREEHPDLAEAFVVLGEELNKESNTHLHDWAADTDAAALNELISLQKDFEALIGKIREQSGFSKFLLPLSPEEMMAAADRGPIVVINVSSLRCDALIVEKNHIRAILLKDLRLDEVLKRIATMGAATKEGPGSSQVYSPSFLSPLLEWMWKIIALPILEALGIAQPPEGDQWPHIWWVTTFAMSFLPIHAAGIHGNRSRQTVIDRVISSYTPSIKSLVHIWERPVYDTSNVQPQHALLVSMAETPHQTPLPFATEDVTTIEPILNTMNLTVTKGIEHTDEALKHMKYCKILHFAGHGLSSFTHPANSCILTTDWETNPLTVEKLRRETLQDASPFLAYLSSCSAARSRFLHTADEAIHLITAYQLAGFRHSIGALWEVSDWHCVDVAKIVYETLREEKFTDRAVALGLHRVTLYVRDHGQTIIQTRPQSKDSEAQDGGGEDSTEDLQNLEGDLEGFEISPKVGADEERDAVPIAFRRRPMKEQIDSFLWIPYVHYGA
ncbi:uncharacterized protein ASPGLDRAFT_115533 [Aspergillus glaucus CBS 516.65]|uniref:CHAT domain-containing protein n=1 Tax=Aspergillus glaucus CBS 516.65 TaxID=1160497 RepID=A0A1L9VYI9_ASPGL|nr:hypothetical protein ASPGLDRAFT_115533 [Aspergillus glaucus CBS 516.65]OJJ88965.1 hypothetical protein ASPGLDRAFT_115533 [Aspergillus glaucus CBS 516.65]